MLKSFCKGFGVRQAKKLKNQEYVSKKIRYTLYRDGLFASNGNESREELVEPKPAKKKSLEPPKVRASTSASPKRSTVIQNPRHTLFANPKNTGVKSDMRKSRLQIVQGFAPTNLNESFAKYK